MAEEQLPPSLVRDAAYDVVALAASAGGFGALSTVLGSLESSFPAPLVIVQHLDLGIGA